MYPNENGPELQKHKCTLKKLIAHFTDWIQVHGMGPCLASCFIPMLYFVNNAFI